MVKNKKSKHPGKKRYSEAHNLDKKEKRLRENFYRFQKKVEKLEEIRREIFSLENRGLTKGLEKEIAIIKSRLKDTTAIPELEKQMHLLRKEIMERREIKRKSPLKKIGENVEEVVENVEGISHSNMQIKKEIKNLEDKVNVHLDKKINFDSEVGIIVDSEFQSFLNGLKSNISDKIRLKQEEVRFRLKKDLILKKKELNEKYHLMEKSLREQYSQKFKNVEEFKKKLSEMEAQKKRERDRYEKENEEKIKHFHELLERNEKFNEMLKNHLIEKKYLIDQLREKNKSLVDQQSLLKQEEARKLNQEHDLLIQAHKREIKNLSERLKKHFNNAFDKKLGEHTKTEKKRLYKEYRQKVREWKRKTEVVSSKSKKAFKQKLQREYGEILRKSISEKTSELTENLKKQYSYNLANRVMIERARLENHIKELEEKYKAREQGLKLKEKAIVESQRAKALNLASEKRTLAEKLQLVKKNEELKFRHEKEKLKRDLAERMHREMLNELKKRENLLKENMRKHFEHKLKEHEIIQEQELARKKAELAKELQHKAKNLFG
ncbi:MAG: hypothetical protein WC533_02625 [Candidatus Pacearchaeota archaeon]